MIFYYHANKTHFHKKGFALGLVLRVRVLELGNGLLEYNTMRNDLLETASLLMLIFLEERGKRRKLLQRLKDVNKAVQFVKLYNQQLLLHKLYMYQADKSKQQQDYE